MSNVIEFPAKPNPRDDDDITQRLDSFLDDPTQDISHLDKTSQKLFQLLAGALAPLKEEKKNTRKNKLSIKTSI